VGTAAELQSIDWRKRRRLSVIATAGSFAVALPRDVGKPGFRCFLFDREGKRWPIARIDDKPQAVSPYYSLVIANGGKTIVAYDSTRLFTLPVSAIMVGENEVK
jgi:hypothetical protein